MAAVLIARSGPPRRRLAATLGLALQSALGLATPAASAHAPPLAAQVVPPAPGDGGEAVIVTNRGLVFVDRESGDARLLCNEALRITTAELPKVTRLGGGALLVAASSGLRLSRDRGCTWSDVGQMETTHTSALASDPHDPDTVFVASYDSDVPGLRVTRDGGASWSLSLQTDAPDYVHSLLVSAADPAVVYATLATYAPAVPPSHSLLRSRDGGQSWGRLPLPLNEGDYRAVAAASSPDDAGVLVLYTVANSPGLDESRLLLSRDGGDSFEVALARPEIRGAGHGGDGRLWVAARDGLYAASEGSSAFVQTSGASELGCVLERAGALLVCGHYGGLGGSPGVGISSDGGRSFETWLDFSDVDAPVQCPAESLTSALCARPWLDWQTELLGATSGADPVDDAAGLLVPSAPTAGASAGVEPTDPGATDGAVIDPHAGGRPVAEGCALAARAAATYRLEAAVLALLAGLCLRRRAAAHQRSSVAIDGTTTV